MNREFMARLRAIRDGLREYAAEIDVMFPLKEEDEKQHRIEEAVTNWTSADQKAGIYIKDLNEATQLKNEVIIGQVENIMDKTQFNRKDGTEGYVQNIMLSDPSGKILTVFWDEQIAKIKDLMIGQHIKITNAWQVKRNKHGVLELHPGKFAKVELVE
jgi:hypothetical protein